MLLLIKASLFYSILLVVFVVDTAVIDTREMIAELLPVVWFVCSMTMDLVERFLWVLFLILLLLLLFLLGLLELMAFDDEVFGPWEEIG